MGRTIQVTLAANLTIHHPGPLLPHIIRMARWRSKEGYAKRIVRLWRYDAQADTITVPRGLWPLPESWGSYKLDDQRLQLAPRSFRWRGPELDAYQKRAAARLVQCDGGPLLAPTGSGKTVMALRMIAAWRQPCLWIVHSEDLARYALDDARAFFTLPHSAYGRVADGRCDPGTHFTVGLRQTLVHLPRSFFEAFGTVFVDELDLSAARQHLRILSRCRARYRAGGTATYERTDGLHPVVTAMLGRARSEITEDQAVAAGRFQRPIIRVRPTDRLYEWPGSWPALQRERAMDTGRNWLIALDVAREFRQGHSCLVLVQLLEHVALMQQMLSAARVPAEEVTGQVDPEVRGRRIKLAARGGRCLIATKLINRGVNLPVVDRLFLADSYRSAPTVRQQIGRVTRTARGKLDAVVYDYWDRGPQFEAQQRARLQTYGDRGWELHLPEEIKAACRVFGPTRHRG